MTALTLVLFKGYPGTGKSVLAKLLSEELGWALIVRDHFKSLLHKHDFPGTKIGATSYDMMWDVVRKNLSVGISTVCDTSLNQPESLRYIKLISRQYKAKIVVIECFCQDLKVHKNRLEARKNRPFFYDCISSWDQYREFLDRNEHQSNYRIPYPLLKVDTSTQVNPDQILHWIRSSIHG